MKKNVWIAIITIITICCVVGGTIYHIGIYGIRFWGRNEVINTNADLEAFDVLKVDANLMDITITEGDRFYLSCEHTDGLEPIYEVKNGTLSIKQHRYQRWGINNSQCRLSLTIPAQSAMDTIDVQTAMGNVHLDGITVSKCELQSNMGNCIVKNCSIDEAELGTNMGDITVSSASLGNAKASNDMGTVKVETSIFDRLDVTASMGDIRVDSAQKLDGNAEC